MLRALNKKIYDLATQSMPAESGLRTVNTRALASGPGSEALTQDVRSMRAVRASMILVGALRHAQLPGHPLDLTALGCSAYTTGRGMESESRCSGVTAKENLCHA